MVNVLFNRDVVKSESSFNGVTDEIVMFKCKGQVFDQGQKRYVDRDIIVTDTIGLSDRQWDEKNSKKLIEFLREHISCNFKHFDLVYVVFQNDILVDESIKNINNVLKWLDYENHINRVRFIITKTDNLDSDEKENLKNQAIEMFKIKLNKTQTEATPIDKHLIYFTAFPPEYVDGVENIAGDEQKNQIKNDLKNLCLNMKHADPSTDRMKVVLTPSHENQSNEKTKWCILI